ncbi:cupredoxin domain-containing protein [Patescibacteria group bacterium]|nr:cupredoxin domain-containing protein [Patescibacteria group bacterium]
MTKIFVTIVVVLIVAVAVIAIGGKLGKKATAPVPSVTQTQTQQQSQQTGTTSATKETVVNVTVTKSGFNPQTVTIKAGTKVIWQNQSGDMATVNSDPHPTHQIYPPLNLGGFANGASVQLVFDKPGTYGYHNHLNPGQTGTVVVQ